MKGFSNEGGEGGKSGQKKTTRDECKKQKGVNLKLTTYTREKFPREEHWGKNIKSTTKKSTQITIQLPDQVQKRLTRKSLFLGACVCFFIDNTQTGRNAGLIIKYEFLSPT